MTTPEITRSEVSCINPVLFIFYFSYLVGIVANNGFLTSEASLKVTQYANSL